MMRAIWTFGLVFLGVFQTLKCQFEPFQNGYNNYPQRNVRQVGPNQGAPGGMLGQGQQPPMNGGQNQGNGQMPPNQQQFPQVPPSNQQQIPGQQFPPSGQPFQQPGGQTPGQPFAPPGQIPGQPFAPPGQIPGQPFPQPGQGPYPYSQNQPYGMNLTPEGQWAYSFIMQQIAQILNDPISRNGMLYLINSLRTILSNPNSIGIMQEFVNRWTNALNHPGYGGPNVIVQTVQPSSFLDMIKRKGTALVNLAKDVTVAKANAYNTIFGDTPLASFARAGTNMATAGMQGVEGMMAPFLNGPGSGGMGNTMTTPGVGSFSMNG